MKLIRVFILLRLAKAQCGQTEFTEDEGEITSPNFPNNYGNNLNCIYNLRAPPGVEVVMTITDLQIENDPQCRFDSLRIQYLDTGQNNIFCNVLNDPRNNPNQSGTGPAQLTFTSDGGVAQSGFRVTYQIIRPDPCLDEPCQNGAQCIQVVTG